MTTFEILRTAKEAQQSFTQISSSQKNAALLAMAESLEKETDTILKANYIDLEKAKEHISSVMLDRLALNEERIVAMAEGIRQVMNLPDPVGRILKHTECNNGLIIEKTTVPIGVIAIIYESRPNVTSDAAALAIKSGNVCVLRSGKDAFNSANAIVNALRIGLEKVGLPREVISLVQDTSHDSSRELMTAVGLVDLLIPRGGEKLINSCIENATVPCIQTGTGICHIYVDKSADLNMALNIIENAKTSRPSVCNAAEVCLLHVDIAKQFLPMIKNLLVEERIRLKKQPVELRLDDVSLGITDGTKATSEDFNTEFLDYILAVKVVNDVSEAIKHISTHSTGHSESIITEDKSVATMFTSCVDSAAVYVNASTRFTDGGEFGLGCEMGISTQKLHARGPMGVEELTTYKYIVRGNGQIR